MKKKLLGTILIILLSSLPVSARYNPEYDKYISKKDLVGFVKEAVAFAKIYGKKTALLEYKNKRGLFVRGELYIFAYDTHCKVLSHGSNPSLIGKDLSLLEDNRGTRIVKEMVEEIEKNGKGWLKFYWFHPTTKRVMPKLGYFEKVDDNWWLGSGIYLGEYE